MDMVLAMLMAYVWAGAVWPHIVRNRQLFALGFAAVLAAMLLGTLRLTFFAHVLELGAFVTLVGSAAGAINPLWRDLRFR